MNITYIGVWVAGITSFFSACILPLLPAYISYLLGDVVLSEKEEVNKKRLWINSVGFVVGLGVILTLLGLTATVLGRYLLTNTRIIEVISGVIIIIFGILQLGIIKIRFLDRDYRKIKMNGNVTFVKAILLGMMFGFGWTPCMGPQLATVLALSANAETMLEGISYGVFYYIGLALPFLAISMSVNHMFKILEFMKKYIKIIKFIGGSIIILLGINMIL